MKKPKFTVDPNNDLTPDQQAIINGVMAMVLVSFVLFIIGIGALVYAYILISGHAA